MQEIILEAVERIKQSGKFKEIGYVPGILYGDGITEAASVKFEEKALNKILSAHGPNAKIWIDYKDNKKFGFFKEVQREPMSGKVAHLDVQIVSKDHEIRRQVPIVFKGEEILLSRQLQLQVYKPEISVFGKIAVIPDTIYVDVTEMQLGDSITFSNLKLDDILKNENEDTIFGMIINKRNQTIEFSADTETKDEPKSN
ncbi:MAG: 50S ribosomal protein L25 [Anaerocolumna sp.]